MEGFSYYNIFETKGIEYIAVIAFLLLLIPFWLVLTRPEKIRLKIRKALGFLSPGILRIPQGVYHSNNHTWAYLRKYGTARIGLDDLLLHITGDVKVSHIKKSGEMVNKGELIARIDQDGKSLEIFSPISGMILRPNALLDSSQEVLSEDPYGNGWICEMTPSDWKADVASLYLAGEASDYMHSELNRYKDFLAVKLSGYSGEPAVTVLQDGGEIADNSLAGLPAELWQDFQKEFLNPQERQ